VTNLAPIGKMCVKEPKIQSSVIKLRFFACFWLWRGDSRVYRSSWNLARKSMPWVHSRTAIWGRGWMSMATLPVLQRLGDSYGFQFNFCPSRLCTVDE